MVSPIHIQANDHHMACTIPLAIGLFVSVSAITALCAKHAGRLTVPRKTSYSTTDDHDQSKIKSVDHEFAPKSPLRTPKKFIASISNKAIPFIYNRKASDDDDDKSKVEEKMEEGFGEGGLWQKDIWMGEKCQPLEFSGVIYYDCDGKQIAELPKSPRANSFPTFSFPVLANDKN